MPGLASWSPPISRHVRRRSPFFASSPLLGLLLGLSAADAGTAAVRDRAEAVSSTAEVVSSADLSGPGTRVDLFMY